jgi:hypothetical protein
MFFRKIMPENTRSVAQDDTLAKGVDLQRYTGHDTEPGNARSPSIARRKIVKHKGDKGFSAGVGRGESEALDMKVTQGRRSLLPFGIQTFLHYQLHLTPRSEESCTQKEKNSWKS